MASRANRVIVVLDSQDNVSPAVDQIAARIRGLFGAGSGGFGGILNQGFQLARRGVDAFIGAIQSASESQSDMVKSVGSLATVLGKPFEMAQDLNQQITEGLARYAAALPGNTDSYVKLFRLVSDDVAMMNAEMNGGAVNIEQYKEQVTELTAKFRALGDGLTESQIGASLQGLLAGRSLASLQRLAFFQRNPALRNALEGQLNGRNLKELSGGERLDVILKSLNVALSDDTVARLTGTVDSTIQGFLTKLFDPTVGYFGLLRDLDRSTQGVQSAFNEINKVIISVIGDNGVLMAVVNLLRSMGIEFGDPMVALRDAANFFNEKIVQVTNFLNETAALTDPSAIQDELTRLPGEFYGWVSGFVDFISDGLANLDLAASANQLVAITMKNIQNIDYFQLGQSIANALSSIFYSIVNFAANLDVGQVALFVGQTAVKSVQLIAGILAGFFDPRNFQRLNFRGRDRIVNALSGLSTVAGNFINSMSQMLTSVGDGLMRAFQFITDPIGSIIRFTIENVNRIYTLVSDLFRSIQTRVSSLLGIANPAQTGFAGVATFAANAIPNRAAGQIPSFLAGILNEARAMPSGARPVIANTSEAILNRAQQAALGRAIAPSQSGGFVFSGTLNIVTQATDAQGIAREVMGAIASEYRAYRQSVLTPVVN
jgi:hypothetical protein